jgi:predicted nucleic acid-binding protein
MLILADTNILLRSVEPEHRMHAAACDSAELLRRRGHSLCIFPQCVYEFWVVATRPKKDSGLGMEPAEAVRQLNGVLAVFDLLADTSAVFPECVRLVGTHSVRGKPAHDARLVAAMTVHAVTHLLTFNDADFRRYPGITTLTPAGVMAGSHP